MELQKQRPPYFTFEVRKVEKRKPISAPDAGMIYYDYEDFVIITPQGSKDRTEKLVVDWFSSLADRVRMEMYPQEWLDHHRAAYEAWKHKKEIPLDGTPIRGWPLATEAEQERCLSINLRTVEDLANANHEALGRLGMGAEPLKQRAQNFLTAQKDHAPLVAKVEAQALMIEHLMKNQQALQDENNAFKQMMKMGMQPGGQGVPMPQSRPAFDNTSDPIDNAVENTAAALAAGDE